MWFHLKITDHAGEAAEIVQSIRYSVRSGYHAHHIQSLIVFPPISQPEHLCHNRSNYQSDSVVSGYNPSHW